MLLCMKYKREEDGNVIGPDRVESLVMNLSQVSQVIGS